MAVTYHCIVALLCYLMVCTHSQAPLKYALSLAGGWSLGDEGFVLVQIGSRRGTMCAKGFNMKVARVICRELGQGAALDINKNEFYGGLSYQKVVSEVKCNGNEASLNDCTYVTTNINCRRKSIAGVMCENAPPRNRPTPPPPSPTTQAPTVTTQAPPVTTAAPPSGPLPDLRPDAQILSESVYIEERTLGDLQCAMEENCVSESGLRLRDTPGFERLVRSLLRFSSSVKNVGDVDFRPNSPRNTWQWHECHGHYHSMEAFALYDILDNNGVKKAEGHKASFCLMDVSCDRGVRPKFRCGSTSDDRGGQGISVGCADDYTADLDCQWIDITDLAPGEYILRIHVNPNKNVAEKRYDNNIVSCDITYRGGTSITTNNCRNGL